MKLTFALISVAVLIARYAEGMKTTYNIKANSHYTQAYQNWLEDGCLEYNYVFLYASDGVSKSSGNPSYDYEIIYTYGYLFSDCSPDGATLTQFYFYSDSSTSPGAFKANGINAASIAVSGGASVATSTCSTNYYWGGYYCPFGSSDDDVPFSLDYSIKTSGDLYPYKDKSIRRGPGYAVKSNTVSSCKYGDSSTLAIALDDDVQLEFTDEDAYGQVCMYKSGFMEKTSVV